MAARLAAAVADPLPKISKRMLTTVLFGPERWAECIVAVDGGAIVGFIIASRYFEAHTGKRQLRISDLFVDDSVRRGGLGRALFARLLRRARVLSCHEVAWEVWKSNLAAYNFYRSLSAQHVDDVTVMRIQL